MAKQDYSHFKTTDFLLNEDFCRWMRTDNPALKEFWRGWIVRHPQQRQEFENAQVLFRSLQFSQQPVSKETIDAEWDKLQATIHSNNLFLDKKSPAPKRRHERWWLSAASVLLLLIGGISFFYFQTTSPSSVNTLQKTALKGERIRFKLEDGTEVTLNSGSTLLYPETFAAEKREVTLKGEAFFEVAPNRQAPFLITSGTVKTEVVGTSFGVEAYPGCNNVHIAVVSGKVNVYASENTVNNTKVTLTPKQMATFENKDKAFIVKPFEQDKQLAWVEGVLYFDKADFKQVMNKLERWYGVSIILDPGVEPTHDLLLTGKFKNKTLQYILDSYKYPDRFRYTIRNDTITIH